MTVTEEWNAQRDARRSLADALEPRFDHLSRKAVEQMADWILANAPYVTSVLGSLATGEREKAQLQQQRTASFGDVEALEEECYELTRELAVKQRMLADAKAGHVDRYSPDDARAQEDTDRLNAETAAEKAIAGAPRVAS